MFKSSQAAMFRNCTVSHPEVSNSFSDKTEEGELIGCGYYSLLCQLKTRVEHLNRNNTMGRLRKPKRTGGEVDDSNPQHLNLPNWIVMVV